MYLKTRSKRKENMGRTVVSTTLAYTGGYIFLVLLAVCLATVASLSSLSLSLSLSLSFFGLLKNFGSKGN